MFFVDVKHDEPLLKDDVVAVRFTELDNPVANFFVNGLHQFLLFLKQALLSEFCLALVFLLFAADFRLQIRCLCLLHETLRFRLSILQRPNLIGKSTQTLFQATALRSENLDGS